MRRSPRPLLSWLFLALSVGLFAAGAVLYIQGREAEDEAEIPIAAPGKNELIHVVAALEAEDLEVETLSGAVRSLMLEVPGQPLAVDGVQLYVFIYQPDANAQEEVTLDIEPNDVDLETVAGDPVTAENPRLLTDSNVAVVLIGGDDALAEKVAAALKRLP